MEKLQEINNLREKLLQEYITRNKSIWTELEGKEAYDKSMKLLQAYRHKDKFLENAQARLESALSDIGYYKEFMEGK